MSRKAHQPDSAQRRQVEAIAEYGIPEEDISRVVGVDPKTLRKHYREELDWADQGECARGGLSCSTPPGTVTSRRKSSG